MAAKALEPWSHLPGKVVMVTGASSGIGRELCLDLARAGCFILAAARRVDRLKSLCDDINRLTFSGPDLTRAVAVELDVSADGPTIGKSVNAAWEAFGRIDALINNAGVRGRGGSVINISSISGLQRGQLPGGVVYAASKAALTTLTKMMALELGEHKIRVNCISPGIFKSEITESLMQKDWLKKVNMKIIPLKTNGTTDPALTSLTRYLIHESSEYVSGNIFIVDAGVTLPGVPIFSSL